MKKNIYVGKADWGYFIDVQCDEEHNGEECECKNIDIVETKKEALEIGRKSADEYNIPLLTDWDDGKPLSCDHRELIAKAEKLGWTITREDTYWNFQQFSPAGQDFNLEIDYSDDVSDMIDSIYKFWEDYDVSQEAYLWLDNTGHGHNGAPSDMRDVYNDMEACETMVKKLHDVISS